MRGGGFLKGLVVVVEEEVRRWGGRSGGAVVPEVVRGVERILRKSSWLFIAMKVGVEAEISFCAKLRSSRVAKKP